MHRIKIKDPFKLREAQVVLLECRTSSTENECVIPAIITAVHEKDINEVVPYNFAILVSGGTEFLTPLEHKERYLHRFISMDHFISSSTLKEIATFCAEIPESAFSGGMPESGFFFTNESGEDIPINKYID